MKNPFRPGDQKRHAITVDDSMIARFEAESVHEVYSTFSLAKHAEWAGRLFVLEMLEAGEQGIGTHLSIDHLAPALVGERVQIIATLEQVDGRAVWCSFEALVGERLIAKGRSGQKIIEKARFDRYLATLQSEQA